MTALVRQRSLAVKSSILVFSILVPSDGAIEESVYRKQYFLCLGPVADRKMLSPVSSRMLVTAADLVFALHRRIIAMKNVVFGQRSQWAPLTSFSVMYYKQQRSQTVQAYPFACCRLEGGIMRRRLPRCECLPPRDCLKNQGSGSKMQNRPRREEEAKAMLPGKCWSVASLSFTCCSSPTARV